MKKQNDTSEIEKAFPLGFFDREDNTITRTFYRARISLIEDYVEQALHKRDEYWKGEIEGLFCKCRGRSHHQTEAGYVGNCKTCNRIIADEKLSELNTNIDTLLKDNEK